MKSLKKFYAAHNSIGMLREELGDGQLIEEIDLSYNNLEGELSFDFQKIRMLRRLNLAHNQIKTVNATLVKMEYLTELDISFNNFVTLQRLPKSIKKFNCAANNWKLEEPQYESHRARVRHDLDFF